jgi:hypothetical protein
MGELEALLAAINRAGYGYTSEWIGNWDDRDNMIAKVVVRKGRRKVGEWFGPKPSAAARKACAALGLEAVV